MLQSILVFRSPLQLWWVFVSFYDRTCAGRPEQILIRSCSFTDIRRYRKFLICVFRALWKKKR